jgi:VIT1/CCC1 family predicted Fe2+/Mn2+ transporter
MNIFLWAVQIILCVKFLSVAYTHAFRRDKAEMQQAMEKIGPIAPPLLILDAIVMFLGSLGLVLPAVGGSLGWLAPWAALLLAALTLFSIGFHLFARESPKVWVSLVLFALAAFVAYGRWVVAPL